LRAILASNFVKEYNPFIEYFENNALKHEPEKEFIISNSEIDKLSSFVKAENQDSFNIQFKKAIVRTLAIAINKKGMNKHAFILVSPEQHIGKTSFIKFLVPEQLIAYYTENIGTDKDSLISLCENLIINLDELSVLSKFEINKLKSLFSKEDDKSRRPYDSRPIRRKRTASFWGSTNDGEFLNDPTGSVRWLCFKIIQIDFNYSNAIDINKVWAEAYWLYKNNFNYQLTKEEIKENENANTEFQINSVELELIVKHFTAGTKDNHIEFYTATDILEYLNKRYESAYKLNTNNIGKALTQLGFIKDQKKGNNYPVKGYYLNLIEKY
jgi:predicted P-loop ATPase